MILRLITFIMVSVSISAVATSDNLHSESISKSISSIINPNAFHLCGGANEGRSLDKLEGYRAYNVYAVQDAEGKWESADLTNGARKCVTVLSNKYGNAIEGRIRPKLDDEKDDFYSQMDGRMMPGLIENTRYAPIRTGYPTQPDQIYWAARGCSCVNDAVAAANGLSLLYIQRKENDPSSRYEYAFYLNSEDPEIKHMPRKSDNREENPESDKLSNSMAQAIDKHSTEQTQPHSSSSSLPSGINAMIDPEANTGNQPFKLTDKFKKLIIGPADKSIIPLMEQAALLDKSGAYQKYLVRLENHLTAQKNKGKNEWGQYIFDESEVYDGPNTSNSFNEIFFTPKCGCLTEALKRHVGAHVPELSDLRLKASSADQPKALFKD